MVNVTRQKGVSNSNPSELRRWLISFLLNRAGSQARAVKRREKLEQQRVKQNRRHTVEYFHQVNDPNSHLTLQALEKLKKQYDIDVVVHIVSTISGDNFPEPDLWQQVALKDARTIAPFYQLDFPKEFSIPQDDLVLIASKILCNSDQNAFIAEGVKVSDALWRCDLTCLQQLAEKYGLAPDQTVADRLASAHSRLNALKHFGAANFYYEGEWYWKVDRIYHLENRLIELGAARSNRHQLVAPRPQVPSIYPESVKAMTLEYYVSLRSPYTAISWQPTIKMASISGINLKVCPVLPMVMRGVPATYDKGMYFWFDVAREAAANDIDFDKFYDPIGDPVMKGYSLYSWAKQQGSGNDFFEAFLSAAFVEGINLNSLKGLKQLVDSVGLDWSEAKNHLSDTSWRDEFEENRQVMYKSGNWGVPCYRLLDENGKELLCSWGQDRLWLVAETMIKYGERIS
ncbi:MAG: DsbA family protein [Kangiellaceae bacterium]|jgi:2-hydroxychromene-2-carboxylate isomerase|nr:DsbA family protein [Kangiellaceae bacterium]